MCAELVVTAAPSPSPLVKTLFNQLSVEWNKSWMTVTGNVFYFASSLCDFSLSILTGEAW